MLALLTEEQEMLKETAAQMAASVAPANPSDLATVDRVKGWASLATAGLLSLRQRDQSGTPAASGVEVMLVAQALGEALAPLPYVGTIAAADLLARAGAPVGWLEELGAGDTRYGLLLRPDLTALADVGEAGAAVGFDVDGASYAVAVAGPADAPTPVRVELTSGIEDSGAADLTRRTVRVANVTGLASEAAGSPLVPADRDRWLSLALTVVAADLVGTMSGALRKAVEYAKEREQYGVKIGTFQAIQHLCADALVQIEAAASATRYASWALDATDPADALLAARVAKAYTSFVAAEVTETVMQVFGGIGQTWEHIAHVHTRRALTDRVVLGDDSHHLLHIADARLARYKENYVSTRLGYPVFDADNHLYETREALTKYLPDAYRGVIDYVEVHGRTKIVVRGQISDYIPNPTFDRVGRPGAQEEYFKHGNPDGKSQREIIGRGIDCPPAFREASARLELLDEQGVDYAIMLPTLASLIEERMRDDPDLCAAAIHALNTWMLDAWPYCYENRIFSTPIITPGILHNAVTELAWLVEHGAKVVLMRPAPAWGYQGPRSFALPEFDPFWDLVEETETLVVLHASDTGYVRYFNEWEGARTEALAFAQPSPFGLATTGDHRDIKDAVTSLICHGALRRHPGVRVALIENGAGWVPGLLQHLDHTWSQMPQAFAERPSETFKRQFWMHPFHEEDPRQLIELLGAEHVIFGSDYPHVEGLADPVSWAAELEGLPDETVRKVMGGNMIEVLGIRAAVAA